MSCCGWCLCGERCTNGHKCTGSRGEIGTQARAQTDRQTDALRGGENKALKGRKLSEFAFRHMKHAKAQTNGQTDGHEL